MVMGGMQQTGSTCSKQQSAEQMLLQRRRGGDGKLKASRAGRTTECEQRRVLVSSQELASATFKGRATWRRPPPKDSAIAQTVPDPRNVNSATRRGISHGQ